VKPHRHSCGIPPDNTLNPENERVMKIQEEIWTLQLFLLRNLEAPDHLHSIYCEKNCGLKFAEFNIPRENKKISVFQFVMKKISFVCFQKEKNFTRNMEWKTPMCIQERYRIYCQWLKRVGLQFGVPQCEWFPIFSEHDKEARKMANMSLTFSRHPQDIPFRRRIYHCLQEYAAWIQPLLTCWWG